MFIDIVVVYYWIVEVNGFFIDDFVEWIVVFVDFFFWFIVNDVVIVDEVYVGVVLIVMRGMIV